MPIAAPRHKPQQIRCVRPTDPRPSAAKRGYDHRWRELRLAKLREQPTCEWPRCDAAATEVDHIWPLAMGGPNESDNLQSLCKSHHSAKTMMQSVNPKRRKRTEALRGQ